MYSKSSASPAPSNSTVRPEPSSPSFSMPHTSCTVPTRSSASSPAASAFLLTEIVLTTTRTLSPTCRPDSDAAERSSVSALSDRRPRRGRERPRAAKGAGLCRSVQMPRADAAEQDSPGRGRITEAGSANAGSELAGAAVASTPACPTAHKHQQRRADALQTRSAGRATSLATKPPAVQGHRAARSHRVRRGSSGSLTMSTQRATACAVWTQLIWMPGMT